MSELLDSTQLRDQRPDQPAPPLAPGRERDDRGGLVALVVVAALAGTLAVISATWPTVTPTRSDNRQPGVEHQLSISDLPFTAVSNGLGPVERDQTNGGPDVDDGVPLVMGGRVFDRGLGVHAPSRVRLYPGANCTRLVANIGVGDEADRRARVVFKVVVAGIVRFTSEPMTGQNGFQVIDMNFDQPGTVDLVVDDAEDGAEYDAANWADAFLMCRD